MHEKAESYDDCTFFVTKIEVWPLIFQLSSHIRGFLFNYAYANLELLLKLLFLNFQTKTEKGCVK